MKVLAIKGLQTAMKAVAGLMTQDLHAEELIQVGQVAAITPGHHPVHSGLQEATAEDHHQAAQEVDLHEDVTDSIFH